jgi:hypothetical protein
MRLRREAVDEALEQSADQRTVEQAADEALGMSSDNTFERMHDVVLQALDQGREVNDAQ